MTSKSKNSLKTYEIIIFDSDGVILNSNKIKENAFIQLAEEYRMRFSKFEIINLIRKNKGKSRYEIVKRLLEKTKNKELINENVYSKLLIRYSSIVKEKLKSCECSKKIKFLRINNNSSWLVLTAGDQQETIEIYKEKSIYQLFDLGIYGAPNLKNKNLIEINKSYEGFLKKKILYIGDSIKDFELARENNFDFVLIKDWSTCKKIKNIIDIVENYSSLDEFISYKLGISSYM